MYLNQIKSKNKSEILKYLLIHVVELTDYKISCMSIKKTKKKSYNWRKYVCYFLLAFLMNCKVSVQFLNQMVLCAMVPWLAVMSRAISYLLFWLTAVSSDAFILSSHLQPYYVLFETK